MKKLALPLLCLVLLFASCSPAPTALEVWEENSKLDAEETRDELYEAALNEDILRVFTVSTRMLQVAEAFEEEYPGLLVEVSDLRGEQLISDVKATIDSGEFACDIMFLTDVNGALTNDLIPNGYAINMSPTT